MLRVRLLARRQRRDDLALAGHDVEEDIGGHDRRHQRAGMDQRAAPGKDAGEGPARGDDIAEAEQAQHDVVLPSGERHSQS